MEDGSRPRLATVRQKGRAAAAAGGEKWSAELGGTISGAPRLAGPGRTGGGAHGDFRSQTSEIGCMAGGHLSGGTE